MPTEVSPFSALVEQRLAALGTNAFAAEQAARLPPDAIRNVIRSQKKDGPSISRAKEICDALGLEFYIGPKRDLRGFSDPAGTSELSDVEAIRAGFLPIPWHQEAMKRGSAPVALQASWLASEGISPDGLTAIVPTQVGFSLSEAKNTVAILETAALQKGSGALWCYRDGGELGVSRAAFNSDVIVLFPGADEGEARIVDRKSPSGLKMLGRVVWLGLLPKP